MNLSLDAWFDNLPMGLQGVIVVVVILMVVGYFASTIIRSDDRKQRRSGKQALANIASYKKEFDVLRKQIQESGLPENRSTLTRLRNASNDAWVDLTYVTISIVDKARAREISDLIWGYGEAAEKMDELRKLADETDFDSLAERVALLDRLKREATGITELEADIGFDADQELSNTLAQASERCCELWESNQSQLFEEIAKNYGRCSKVLELLERANCFQDIRSEDWNAAIVKQADKDIICSRLFRGITIEKTLRDVATVLFHAVNGHNATLAFYLWLKATEDRERVSLDTSTLTDLTAIVRRERADLVPHPYISDARQSD